MSKYTSVIIDAFKGNNKPSKEEAEAIENAMRDEMNLDLDSMTTLAIQIEAVETRELLAILKTLKETKWREQPDEK